MKLHNLINTAFVAALGAGMLTACQGDNTSCNIEGEPVNPDSPQIYFPKAESYYYEFLGDDDKEITVEMARLNYKEALEVPVRVETTAEGFSVPETISFEAGQESVKFVVDCSEIPPKQMCELKITVDESMQTPYAAGSSAYEAKVMILGSWVVIASDVTYTYDYLYTQSSGTLMQLEGTERYKLTNFLGSGLDLPFELGYKSGNRYVISPISNYMTYEEASPGYNNDPYVSWYFYDSENQYWPSWSPDGNETEIDYALIYGMDNDDKTMYTYINFVKGNGKVTISAELSDGSYPWIYADLAFTPTQQ